MYLSDRQLKKILSGCRLNKRGAQKELYRNFNSYAISIAFRHAGNHDHAVEITNEVFLNIYIDLKNFAPLFDNTVASFTAWLKKVVANTYIDHKKKDNIKERAVNVDFQRVLLSGE